MFFVLGENCKLKNEFRLKIYKQKQNELIDKFIKYDDLKQRKYVDKLI